MNKAILKNKNFAKVYISTCISRFGDGLDDIAFAIILYSISKSTLVTSYVFAIKVIFSFITIFTGALSDRMNKKKMVFYGEVGQAIILIILILLNKYFKLNTNILILFSTVQAFLSTWTMPAKNTLSLLTMDKNKLVESKALMNVSLQIIQILSYSISGVLIAKIGAFYLLFFDSITFVISSLLFISIEYKEKESSYPTIKDFKEDIKEGFLFIRNRKIINIILILSFGGNVLMAPIDAIMPAYFENYFKSYGYSSFMVVLTIGGIVSASMLSKVYNKISEFKLFIIGFGFGAIGTLGLTIVSSNAIVCISAFSIGVSFSLVSILNSNILQKLTPDNMLGRVFSIFKCISYLSSPLGMILAGVSGEYIQIRYIFLVSGTLMIGLTIIGFYYLKNESFKVNGIIRRV